MPQTIKQIAQNALFGTGSFRLDGAGQVVVDGDHDFVAAAATAVDTAERVCRSAGDRAAFLAAGALEVNQGGNRGECANWMGTIAQEVMSSGRAHPAELAKWTGGKGRHAWVPDGTQMQQCRCEKSSCRHPVRESRGRYGPRCDGAAGPKQTHCEVCK